MLVATGTQVTQGCPWHGEVGADQSATVEGQAPWTGRQESTPCQPRTAMSLVEEEKTTKMMTMRSWVSALP